MACSSTCPTQDHTSLGECLRSKGVAVTYCNSAGGRDYTASKQRDRDLEAYASARRQGVQPENTTRQAVEDSMILSNESGKAYRADV